MHNPPLFIDFEASGLNLVDSYPIQVGFIDTKNSIQKYFISPENIHDWTSWCTDAENIHHFPREHVIQHGLHPHEIAKILNKELMNCHVYCNGYANDLFWCNRLYNAANQSPTFEIKDFFSLIPKCFMESPSDELTSFYSFMVKISRQSLTGRAHDAGNDARYLANLYDFVKNAEDLIGHGASSFDNKKMLIKWLMTPVNVLSGNSPASYLVTVKGKEKIKKLLKKIQYGQFS